MSYYIVIPGLIRDPVLKNNIAIYNKNWVPAHPGMTDVSWMMEESDVYE